MGTTRAMLMTRPLLALMLLLCAIAARMLVPAGFMPERVGDRLTLALCTGHGPMVMAAAHDGDTRAPHHVAAKAGGKDATQIDQPCGFGGLGVTLGGGTFFAAPITAMAPALLRKVAAGAPVRAQPSDRLRPPLRAPPRAAATT